MTHRSADSGTQKMTWLKGSLLLGASVSMMLTMAPSAFAQDSDEGDVVIATGIRQALENALIEKRSSDSLIEVIFAEDIGKLPDQNLAEVLENITGVQITRQTGVGTGVQIRGADENRIEINGVTTVGSGTGRNGINFEDVSASIIQGLEVIKAPEAATIEGAVGGTINLRTIRALDLDEDDTLASFRVQFEDASLSDTGLSPRFEGTVGKKWSNAKGQEIGVVLSGSYTEQESTSFLTRSELNGDDAINSGFDFVNPQFFVQDLDNFEAENINFAGGIEAKPTDNLKLYGDLIVNNQDRIQQSSRIQFSGIANTDAAAAIAADPGSVFEEVNLGESVNGDLGTINRAVIGTLLIQPDETDGNLRYSSDTGSRFTDSVILRLGGEWETDNFSARVEYSNSDSESETPSFGTTLNFINPNIGLNIDQLRENAQNGITSAGQDDNESGTTFLFDLSDDQLSFGVSPDTSIGGATLEQLNDPANLFLDQANLSLNETENSEEAFRVDLSYDFEDTSIGNFISSIDAGYRYNETTSDFLSVSSSRNISNAIDSVSADFFPQLLVDGPDNFNDGSDRELFVENFQLIDQELSVSDPLAVIDQLNSAIAASNAQFGFNTAPVSTPTTNQTSSFLITEETDAFYGQANFDFGIVRGNVGARYVETDLTSTGTVILDGVSGIEDTESDHSFFLPRVNVVIEPIENVLIRGSWSEDIRRADFADLNTSVSFSTSPNDDVSIGNASLTPQEVTNFDVGAEWYFAPGAVFSVGYFRKERDGLFVETSVDAEETFTEVFDAAGNLLGSASVRDITDPCEGGGIFNPIADRNVFAPLDATGAGIGGEGVCVAINQVINDPGTTDQQGIEVAFQYDLSSWEDRLGSFGWASGFGLIANYTYQEFSGIETLRNTTSAGNVIFAAASAGQTDVQFATPLENNSENAYNLTVFYEKFGLSARARWTWRDELALGEGLTGFNNTLGTPLIQGSRGQLNASINYDVTDHLTVGVEGVNLTTEDIEQRCVSGNGPLCFAEQTERRVIFGASYKF